MAMCYLCKKNISGQSFGDFGLIGGPLCDECHKDVKLLVDVSANKNAEALDKTCQQFTEKHNYGASKEAAKEIVRNLKSGKRYSSGDTGLYSDPGSTLVTVSNVFFWLCSILGLVLGIAFGNTTNFLGYSHFNFGLFIVPFITGIVVGYFGGLVLAAFGSAVADIKKIREILSAK